ncbi:MAG: hypothetical protein J6N52_00335 [Clostridia bacterium]|nr:hypothetical protein [Clostridia bacterium]
MKDNNKKNTKSSEYSAGEKNSITMKRIKRIVSSLVIAVIVWFVTINVVNPSISVSIASVPVRFVGENALREKGLVLVDRELLPDFSVKVRSTRSELIKNIDRIRIDIDLSGIQTQGKITVTPTVNLPDSVSLEKQKFSGVELSIEPSYEKEIPVVIKQAGDDKIKAKDKIVKSVPEIEKMQIVGSKNEVDAAASCLITIDVSDLEESGKTMYSYQIADSSMTVLQSSSTIYCSNVTVPVNNTIYSRVTRPVKIKLSDELQKHYITEIDEKSITPSQLDIGVPDGVSAPDELEAVFENADYNSGDNEINLNVTAPKKIFIRNPQVTVKAKLTKLVEKTVTVSVNLENVPDWLEPAGNPITEERKVLVPEDAGDEIKAYADASDAQEGMNNLDFSFENENIKGLDGNTINALFNIKQSQ